jgi:UDP-glucose 4-epimerase
VNEFLYRRVDVEDVVAAHVLALEKAPSIGFGRFIITATTPFAREDLHELRINAAPVVARHVPEYADIYDRARWRMFPSIDRVYVNERARLELGWQPRYDFRYVLGLIEAGEDPRSPLARAVGMKPYHSKTFAEGPYPVD